MEIVHLSVDEVYIIKTSDDIGLKTKIKMQNDVKIMLLNFPYQLTEMTERFYQEFLYLSGSFIFTALVLSSLDRVRPIRTCEQLLYQICQ